MIPDEAHIVEACEKLRGPIHERVRAARGLCIDAPAHEAIDKHLAAVDEQLHQVVSLLGQGRD